MNAYDSIDRMISDVQPDNAWLKTACKYAVHGSYGYLIGTCAGYLAVGVLAITGSFIAYYLSIAVLLAAAIVIVLTTGNLVADFVVDTVPAAAAKAYNAVAAKFSKPTASTVYRDAKTVATEKLASAGEWMNRFKRAAA